MTSRLKKKLDNMGVDVSKGGSKLLENFCLVGTPLPSLDKAKDSGEFLPLWKQDVRDEQGRRRLHGAFTGGFSAGYFNTVGSKEGWTPSNFVSSRSSRSNVKTAQAEDYMDEEDLAEMKESQKLVDMTEEMDLLGGTAAERNRNALLMTKEDEMALALKALLPPTQESPAAKLLQKMGWRLGQGIGPRVSAARLKQQDAQSAALPSEAIPLPQIDDSDEAKKHLFAPRDTTVPKFAPKIDTFGLGYSRGARLGLASQQGPSTPISSSSISAGFGLGALNDAEDDDVDIYDAGFEKQSKGHLAYDMNEEMGDTLRFGSSKIEASQISDSTSTAFNDGRPVPSGFALAAKAELQDPRFLLLDIPPGWRPSPYLVWEQNSLPSEIDASTAQSEKAQVTKSENRGKLLGEAQILKTPKSVFDYLSDKDRQRLQNFKKTHEATVNASATPGSEPPSNVTQDVASAQLPLLNPQTARAALNGFQPFTSDPVKQNRYNTFLQSHALDNVAPLRRMSHQTTEDFNKELQDYAKSAVIFKPASGAIANRFTSASVVENGPKAIEGLHQPSHKHDYLESPDSTPENREAPEDPMHQAARLGMFGPLTREQKEWHPAKLLCKRFGVKEPEVAPDSSTKVVTGVASPRELALASGSTGNAMTPITSLPSPNQASQPAASSSTPIRRDPRDLENIGLGEDEDQGRDTLTYEKPTMDIFKAIFASDDEDSDDEVDVSNQVEPEIAALGGKESLAAASNDPVNLSTFKPTFVSRAKRERELFDDPENKKVSSSDRKTKKKKSAKAVLSFDVEESEEGLPMKPKSDKKKRKRDIEAKDTNPSKPDKKEKLQNPDDNDDWIEKPPPPSTGHARGEQEGSVKSGRKTAADFM